MKEMKCIRRKEVTYSPEEWEEVIRRANSASLKPGTYIRRVSLNGAINFYNYSGLPEFLDNLRIFSNDINLLAKKANELNSISEGDYEKMEEVFSQLCRYLNQSLSTLLSTSV